ncbi:hypothetical protein [Stakelama pacifica]|uniref:Uncharacterized protein n=1 Tax=Stakelama pacifica TaxID=517720 RepID=A0A4R6FU65_9SPHN|nr:hypothetical protein [Stakelama pacifica]TDN85409.1 hypothetical protein EV664_102115 [Stakelama pacifica]GGO92732.1 hypothetical protein GCM10011329_10520 [Stakelama pacifica]
MTVALLFLWFALLVLPDIPARRSLERALIEVPARRLNELNRGLVIVTIALAVLGLLLFQLLEQDGMLLFSMALPELSMILASVEVTTLVDIVATALVVSAGIKMRQVTGLIIATMFRPRARTKRTRVQRGHSANDDEDGPATLALAA